MTETIDFSPTGDAAFDHLMQEVNAEIRATNDLILPDEMVASAVERACEFFGLPEVPVIDANGTCVWPNDPGTPFDDVFGFNRHELMSMGIQGEDSLALVYTHECAHRALQSYGDLDPWEHELACDFFAGVHAGLKGIDTDNFEESLKNTTGGKSHPTGQLRAEFIEYGREIAEDMQARHVPVTFEGCLQRFNAHLVDEENMIAQCRTSIEQQAEGNGGTQLSFTGVHYTDAEISKMRDDVSKAEYEVSCRKSDLDNWNSKVSLNNTKEHRANGDYANAVSHRDDARAKYNDAVSRCNAAKAKLNNAL